MPEATHSEWGDAMNGKLRRVAQVVCATLVLIGSGAATAGASESTADSATPQIVSISKAGGVETVKYNDGSYFSSESDDPITIQGGSFTWSARIACCLDSREWTAANSGQTYIKISKSVRLDNGKCSNMKIRLLKSRWYGWEDFGEKTYYCPHPSETSWSTSPGTYKFHIEPTFQGGPYNDVAGSVRYP